jgi:hypothetical protein
MEVQKSRVGLFSSSSIWMLATNGRKTGEVGAPFNTYLQQKKWERKAGRSIQNEAKSKETDWGNLCEPIAFDLLGLEYTRTDKVRYFHPKFDSCGVPDLVQSTEKVCDIKCPFTLNSFFTMAESQDLKSDKKEYYWQLVHNAILTGAKECELILFMPKLARISAIQDEAAVMGYNRFGYMEIDEFPWTADDSEVPEIVKKSFVPPQSDIDFLNERLEMATKLLNS